MKLIDRRAECGLPDRLVDAVCAGESRALVLSGEPGVGTEKRQFMTKRFTPVEIAAQRAIKRVFDPTGLLNPGIMLPDVSPDEPHMGSFEAAPHTAVRGHPTATTAAPTTTTGGSQITVNTANLSLVAGAAATLDEVSRVLTEHGVSCQAIPAESTRRTVGELIAKPNTAERQAVRHALLGLDVALPDGQAPARFGART